MRGQHHALAALYPQKDQVPIVQEAGWAPGPVWTAENLAPPGFDPRTVHPVASRVTDYATRPTKTEVLEDKPVPVPLRPLRGPARDRTRPSAVKRPANTPSELRNSQMMFGCDVREQF